MSNRHGLATVAIAALVLLAGCSGGGSGGAGADIERSGGTGGVSDAAGDGGSGAASGDAGAAESVGVAVGGAGDANAFRANVREGFVPQPTAITHEGLYHDYYFDTGAGDACDRRFCPAYSRAVTSDPLSNETERYLTVGLTSGLSRADFERPPTDVVVVVDTSDSMSEQIDRYYYDEDGSGSEAGSGSGSGSASDSDAAGEAGRRVSKIAAARSAVRSMVGQLGPSDRVGIVAFSDEARVVRELRAVGDGDGVNASVGGLRADGGTNLAAGMRTAELLVEDAAPAGDGSDADASDRRQTRIVYVTDAMPNTGETGGEDLRGRLSGLADRGIYATFVGVGVDFNTRLAETIGGVRGANYVSVDSAERFRERMGAEFDYLVTPLAFDLRLSVAGDGWRVADVYGVPGTSGGDGASDGDADGPDGRELFHVDTLFPSRREGDRTEGSVILLRVEREGGQTGPLRLRAAYETPGGEQVDSVRTIQFPDRGPPYYETTGVRKAVALTRYADLVRNWAAYERTQVRGGSPDEPAAGVETREYARGRWEQQSVPLRVSPVYRDRLDRFATYFEGEARALGADRMREDLRVLERLQSAAREGDETSGDGGNEDGDDAAEVVDDPAGVDSGNGAAGGGGGPVVEAPPTG
jgi:Ca-activated chloride channel family protein